MRLFDAFGNPVGANWGGTTFIPIPGASGASATFSSGAGVTDINGVATGSTLTTNGTAGAFTVLAFLPDFSQSVTFNLMNTPSGAFLSALKVTGGSLLPAFSPGTLAYTESVPNCVASVTVTPTLADPTGSVKVNGVTVASGAPSTPISLVVGVNQINAVVTAQDGITTQTYGIAVTRASFDPLAPVLVIGVARKVHGSAGTFNLPLTVSLCPG